MCNRLLAFFYLFLSAMVFTSSAYADIANDPLPSWNDGGIKQSIIQFVKAVADKSSPDYVPPEERIATIDNDGTLWVEQPLYTQMIFSVTRFREMAASHPEWNKNPEIKALLVKDNKDLTSQDMEKIVALVSGDISVEDFQTVTKAWLATAENPRFKHHYPELVYQPMLEVLKYLHDNKFMVYIVSGGGQDFIRAFALNTYGIPSERVIGTTGKTEYTNQNNQPSLMKIPKLLFISDKAGKPEAIDLFIGKKPILAIGNSDGDRQMLEWTQSNKRRHLMVLVHHDDAKREYAYDTQSKVGTFSQSLFDEAEKNHWQVISMKNDWKVIFPFTANDPH